MDLASLSRLSASPFLGTKLVVKDGGLDICNTLLNDKKYADAVDIIGLHYPTDFQDFSASELHLRQLTKRT